MRWDETIGQYDTETCFSPGCERVATRYVSSTLQDGLGSSEAFTVLYHYCDECYHALHKLFLEAGIPRLGSPPDRRGRTQEAD